MSDFLQFVDRIPTLPNRKKLTFENDGSVKYATVEYADDPAEEGTFLNKYNFNKLNSVLGYNEATGAYNDITNRVEYSLNFDISNFVNNQKILVNQTSDINIPSLGLNDLTLSALSGNFDNLNAILLNNGNIFVIGGSGNSSYYILDSNGTIVKDKTEFISSQFDYPSLMQTNEGKIISVGSTGTTNSMCFIFDINGNVLNSFVLHSTFYKSSLIELSNGNIMAIGANWAGNNLYIIIFDINGNIILNPTQIDTGNYANCKGIKLDNNNIFIFGESGSSSTNRRGSFIIVDNNGDIIKTSTQVGNYYGQNFKIIKLHTGNIFAVGFYNDNVVCSIIDQNGDFVKSSSKISGTLKFFDVYESSNNKIVISCTNSNNYISTAILDETGSLINVDQITNIGANNSYICEIGNNYVYTAYVKAGNPIETYISIRSQDGAFIVSNYKYWSNPFYSGKLIKNDNNIMLIGNIDTSYTTFYFVQKALFNINKPTINGIELNSILSKGNFELVYDETNNKFNSNSINTNILDITLSEAVNQINLQGISNKFEEGKLYALFIYGKSNPVTADNIVFGSDMVTMSNSSGSYYIPFIFGFKEFSGNKYICGISITNNYSTNMYHESKLTSAEYIKHYNNNNKFDIGTRIIIKEVA